MVARGDETYKSMIANLADKIRKSVPAIEATEQVPAFNVNNCAYVLAGATGIDINEIYVDLVLAFPPPVIMTRDDGDGKRTFVRIK